MASFATMCHSNLRSNVVHHDLKLENLLLGNQGDIGQVKVAAFGMAVTHGLRHGGQSQSLACSTPLCAAPEVIMGAEGQVFDQSVDMWSAGVVLYILLSGFPPFWSRSEWLLFDMIHKCNFSFDHAVWKKVSERCDQRRWGWHSAR